MPNPTSTNHLPATYAQPYGSTRTIIHLGNTQMPTRLTLEEAIEEHCPFHNCHPDNIQPVSLAPSLITYFEVCNAI